ncbi:CPBP family intramembrane glutamic endopeptidase [Acidomonas methanolica]|uniref:CPBP family intramembrane glutamic endopeptidase n=1 Tax=Acidomonas methanolica TaxID=437 RepID=UPI00211A8B16|nr:CPBP family intramembrane metalloprotease [Acidomonas methanolica]
MTSLPPVRRGIALLRALTFLGAALVLATVLATALSHIAPLHRMGPELVITPWLIARNDLPLLLAALGAAALTLPRGGRNWRAFREVLQLSGPARETGSGAGAGLVAIGALALGLIVTGGLHIAWSGVDAVRLTLYIPAFLTVALAEELLFRGAMLFWLSRAVGFLPALALTSVLFGLVHWIGSDPWEGAVSAGLIGAFFGLTLRVRRGLWFAIGFHAAWDYGQSAVLGCRDSGIPSVGALFDSTPAGPAWLSGGASGPEGSLLCFTLILGLSLHLLFPRGKRRVLR